MWPFRAWRRKRLLAGHLVGQALFDDVSGTLPLLARLDGGERGRLRELVTLFLHEKSIEGAHDLVIDARMALQIALQACLPVLHLGIDWLDGWVSVVVHPGEFLVDHEEADEAGVVHRVREVRSGESWERGPLVLSWDDVTAGCQLDGYNVVIHEIAHKLDALNGPADGFPPLHRHMDPQAWSAAFSTAFEDLAARADAGEETAIDPYAAEAPEEFFAVTSEYFFELPEVLMAAYPEVYDQLTSFYRSR